MLLISESYVGNDFTCMSPSFNVESDCTTTNLQTKKLKPRWTCFMHILLQILFVFGPVQTAILTQKHNNEV